jgi:hypothetical protein
MKRRCEDTDVVFADDSNAICFYERIEEES